MRMYRIQGLTMGRGGGRRCFQPFLKARDPVASPEALFSLSSQNSTALSDASCQGPSVPLNESHSTSSHRMRPGPLLPQFTLPSARPGPGQLSTEMFAN